MAVKGEHEELPLSGAVRGELMLAIQTGDLPGARAAAEKVTRLLDDREALMGRLEHLSRLEELGRMSAELIHELRQPLLGVKAFTERMAQRPDDPVFVKQRTEKILKQVGRMESIIDRSKRFSREQVPKLRAVDLSLAIREAGELLSPRLQHLGVALQLEVPEGLPWVMADPNELQQIFVNLISNACEAVPARGGWVAIRPEARERHVCVTVSDNGPGVESAWRERIFEPFVSTKDTGTGIGLSVCRRIAQSFGGDVVLIDSPTGAAFELTLLPRT